MWLRLQARRIHARPYCRRLFLRPSRRTFRIFRGYSRSHTCCISELLADRASVMMHLRDPHGVREFVVQRPSDHQKNIERLTPFAARRRGPAGAPPK